MPKRLSPYEQKLRNEMFAQGQLWCSECKQFKPVKEFYRNRGKGQATNYGYRHYCVLCDGTSKRNKERNRKHYQKRNGELKARFVALAGSKCQRCGYDIFQSAMDFHHVYPAEKVYNPTWVIYSGNLEKAWKELDKCCLLCRNCHSAYEGGEWRSEFVKRDGLGWTVGKPLPLDDDRYQAEKPPAYQQSQLPDLFVPKQAGEQLTLFA